MTDYKECNRCSANCRHKGAIRLCICGKFVKVAQTNGEKLRTDTDENLASFICGIANSKTFVTYDEETVLDWLKQEAI